MELTTNEVTSLIHTLEWIDSTDALTEEECALLDKLNQYIAGL